MGKQWKQWQTSFFECWVIKLLFDSLLSLSSRGSLVLLHSEKRQKPWLVLFSSTDMSDSLRPHNCSTPGFLVLHHLPELAQTHVCWVGAAIQPSHLILSLLLPSVFPQHQGLSQCVDCSHQVAKGLQLLDVMRLVLGLKLLPPPPRTPALRSVAQP